VEVGGHAGWNAEQYPLPSQGLPLPSLFMDLGPTPISSYTLALLTSSQSFPVFHRP